MIGIKVYLLFFDTPLKVLIIVAWFVMTILGLVVIGVIKSNVLKAGNPYRLIYPSDYQGNICGYDSPVKNLKAGYYLLDTSGERV